MTGNSTLVTAQAIADAQAGMQSVEDGGTVGGILVQGNVDASGTGFSLHVIAAKTPCKLVAASLVHSNSSANVPADASNFYSVVVQRSRANTRAAIVTRATTLGNAWNKGTDWAFDLGSFDPTNQLFSAGDWLAFQFTQTGTPTVTLKDVAWSARFEPQ